MYSLADSISLSVFVPYGIAAIFFPARFASYLIGGALLLTLGVSGIKQLAFYVAADSTAFRRPAGARDCDLFCVAGPAASAPGFPSGHVATIAFFVTAVWLWQGRPLTLVAVLGGLWILAMGWARWAKSCHTLLQIVSGAVVGVGCGAILFLAYRQNEMAISA